MVPDAGSTIERRLQAHEEQLEALVGEARRIYPLIGGASPEETVRLRQRRTELLEHAQQVLAKMQVLVKRLP